MNKKSTKGINLSNGQAVVIKEGTDCRDKPCYNLTALIGITLYQLDFERALF